MSLHAPHLTTPAAVFRSFGVMVFLSTLYFDPTASFSFFCSLSLAETPPVLPSPWPLLQPCVVLSLDVDEEES